MEASQNGLVSLNGPSVEVRDEEKVELRTSKESSEKPSSTMAKEKQESVSASPQTHPVGANEATEGMVSDKTKEPPVENEKGEEQENETGDSGLIHEKEGPATSLTRGLNLEQEDEYASGGIKGPVKPTHGRTKRVSRLKDGTYFSCLFLEKIFRESRKCKICGAKNAGKPLTDDESSLELYVSEKGLCGRQSVICGECGGIEPVISTDTIAEIPDLPEFRIDGSGIRYYCKKVTHVEVLHDLMELLHIASLDNDKIRQQRHLEVAEFMLYNARKVCREWCKPESMELRLRKFIRLREEALLIRHKPAFLAEHSEDYKGMYKMMAGSFRQHREKIKLLLELLKTTLFDNPTPPSFMLWVSIAMMHVENYQKFKSLYDPKTFMQVDSTEYQALKDRYLSLNVALGIKKIPVVFLLFELPRFYHYAEFLNERLGEKRPAFLSEDEKRTIEKFDRQARKYVMKRKMKSGKLVSAEPHLDMLTHHEKLDREFLYQSCREKEKAKETEKKLQKKVKKEPVQEKEGEACGKEQGKTPTNENESKEDKSGCEEALRPSCYEFPSLTSCKFSYESEMSRMPSKLTLEPSRDSSLASTEGTSLEKSSEVSNVEESSATTAATTTEKWEENQKKDKEESKNGVTPKDFKGFKRNNRRGSVDSGNEEADELNSTSSSDYVEAREDLEIDNNTGSNEAIKKVQPLCKRANADVSKNEEVIDSTTEKKQPIIDCRSTNEPTGLEENEPTGLEEKDKQKEMKSFTQKKEGMGDCKSEKVRDTCESEENLIRVKAAPVNEQKMEIEKSKVEFATKECDVDLVPEVDKKDQANSKPPTIQQDFNKKKDESILHNTTKTSSDSHSKRQKIEEPKAHKFADPVPSIESHKPVHPRKSHKYASSLKRHKPSHSLESHKSVLPLSSHKSSRSPASNATAKVELTLKATRSSGNSAEHPGDNTMVAMLTNITPEAMVEILAQAKNSDVFKVEEARTAVVPITANSSVELQLATEFLKETSGSDSSPGKPEIKVIDAQQKSVEECISELSKLKPVRMTSQSVKNEKPTKGTKEEVHKSTHVTPKSSSVKSSMKDESCADGKQQEQRDTAKKTQGVEKIANSKKSGKAKQCVEVKVKQTTEPAKPHLSEPQKKVTEEEEEEDEEDEDSDDSDDSDDYEARHIKFWRKQSPKYKDVLERILEKKDCTLDKLTDEEKFVLNNHLKYGKRDAYYYDWERRLYSPGRCERGDSNSSARKLRNRLRQKLRERKREGFSYSSKTYHKVEKKPPKAFKFQDPKSETKGSSKQAKNQEVPKLADKKVCASVKVNAKAQDSQIAVAKKRKSETCKAQDRPEIKQTPEPKENVDITEPQKSRQKMASSCKKSTEATAESAKSLPKTEPKKSKTADSSRTQPQENALQTGEATYTETIDPATISLLSQKLEPATTPRVFSADDFHSMLVDHLKANEEAVQNQTEIPATPSPMSTFINPPIPSSSTTVQLNTSAKLSSPVERAAHTASPISSANDSMSKKGGKPVSDTGAQDFKEVNDEEDIDDSTFSPLTKEKQDKKELVSSIEKSNPLKEVVLENQLMVKSEEHKEVKADEKRESKKQRKEKRKAEKLKEERPRMDKNDSVDSTTQNEVGAIGDDSTSYTVKLTAASSYITLSDMEAIETKTDQKNTSPGAFIYKVSTESDKNKHPFREIYKFACKKRNDFDVRIEVSEIYCTKHPDAKSAKPDGISFSCKLVVTELHAPCGKCVINTPTCT